MNEKRYDRVGDTLVSETLPNGLSIFIVPRRDYIKTFAFFATNYGSIDMNFTIGGKEVKSPAGVAHFLEHKMFDMPEENALQTLTNLGASPNAFTSNDITGYFFEATDKFEQCLEVLLKFVSTPYFTSESCSKEQGIIGQEIRMTEDDPNWECYMGMVRSLYREHPVKISVAGTVESIAEITDQTLYDCHRAFYRPNNMVLTVVGNVDPQKVIDIAAEVLPKGAEEKVFADLGKAETMDIAAPYTEKAMEIAGLMFMGGFKCEPAAYGKEFLQMEYLAFLAIDALVGRSSPLWFNLYKDGLLDSSFSYGFDCCRGAAMVTFGGKSREPRAVADALNAEIRRVLNEGLSREYFDLRKKAAYGSMIRRFDSFENVCISQASAYFNGGNMFELPEIVDKISINDVMEFIKNNLTPERLAVSVIKPVKE